MCIAWQKLPPAWPRNAKFRSYGHNLKSYFKLWFSTEAVDNFVGYPVPSGRKPRHTRPSNSSRIF